VPKIAVRCRNSAAKTGFIEVITWDCRSARSFVPPLLGRRTDMSLLPRRFHRSAQGIQHSVT
jgi:hypothetical protein